MRILVHGSQLLYPANTGGRIRTSKLFERLARRHEITWICFRRPDETEAQIAAMGACCARLETFPLRDAEKFSPRFYWQLGRNLMSPHPYVIHKYESPAVRARLRELLKRERFDLLLCDFLAPALNVVGLPFGPRVLFQHNVESMIFQRFAEGREPGAARLYLQHQWRKLLAFEGRAARWFDHNVMVSEEDCAAMARLYGATNTSAIPTGVDADHFRPAAPEGERDGELAFTGSMDWLPNVDAMRFFANDVLPLLRRERAVKLWIVGRKPLPEVRALEREHPELAVTGTVDDVRPYIARAQLYVVPLRIGGGTRMKIFEAMAMGKAVISTRIGAEGLPVTDGRDIVLADEPEEIARRILELLSNDARRRSLGEAGRRLVCERFGWDEVARRLDEICEGVANRPVRGAA